MLEIKRPSPAESRRLSTSGHLTSLPRKNRPTVKFGQFYAVGDASRPNPFALLFTDTFQACMNNTYLNAPHIAQSVGLKTIPQDMNTLFALFKRAIHLKHVTSGPLSPTVGNGITPPQIPPSYASDQLSPPEQLEYDQYDAFNRGRFQELMKLGGTRVEHTYPTLIDQLDQLTTNVKPGTPQYTDALIRLNEFMATGIRMDMNTESGRLDDIAKSKKAYIFVVNHDDGIYDGVMLMGFLKMLYEKYQEHQIQDYPTPKLIIARAVHDSLPPRLQTAFERLQGVPVDARFLLTGERATTNARAMKTVIKGLQTGQNHLIIFPEGIRNLFKDLPYETRFQTGVGKCVMQALATRDEVTVIPLGNEFKREKHMGAFHIGKPLTFRKNGNRIEVNAGNISANTSIAQANPFYQQFTPGQDREFRPITYQGRPLPLTKTTNNPGSEKFLVRHLAGVIADNLAVAHEAASKTLTGL
jgi:hypothetical protein